MMNIQNKINKVIEARKDAEKELKHCKSRDQSFWEGYINGIDYALSALNELRDKQKRKKEK